MHNNYALQHVTLRETRYRALQAAVAALKARARRNKQAVRECFTHTNKNNYTAKYTLVNANAKKLFTQ